MITKFFKILSLSVFIAFFSLHAQNLESEFHKAMDRLNNGKEVYFSFTGNYSAHFEEIDRAIYVDRIDNGVVYAYAATKEQFQKFLEFDLVYQVEINPGELYTFECSDYQNFRTSHVIDKYPTYEGYQNILRQFESEYPDLCKVVEIGKSVKNRTVLGLVITGKNTIPKPRVLWLGAIHGDELTGTMCSFKMFQFLMEKYKAGDARVKRIVDSTEIWTVPFENLDGTYYGGNNTVSGARRTNANGFDLNRSFDCPPGIKKQGQEQQETRNIYSLFKQKRFSIGTDSHGGIECYIYPWCCQSKQHPQRPIYREMGKFLVEKTVGGISSGIGNAMETVGYLAKGCQADYMDYYGNMIGWTFEMSSRKLIPESQFTKYWNKYREMMLCFYELAFTGIQGVITDSATHKGIDNVEVTIGGETEVNLKRYSYNGGYYNRIINAGTYDVTFSHKDYHSRTIKGVKAESLKRTMLSVRLQPIHTGTVVQNDLQQFPLLHVTKKNGKLIFTVNSITPTSEIKIYSINGALIHAVRLQDSNHTVTLDDRFGNGCFFIKFNAGGKQIVQRFMAVQ